MRGAAQSAAAAVAALLFGASSPAPPTDSYVGTVEAAIAAGSTYPRVTQLWPSLTEDEAYALQEDLIADRLKQDGVAGFKGGLMPPSTDVSAGRGPVFGILLNGMERGASEPVRSSKFRKLVIETEIGFEIGQRIDSPLDDIEQLKRNVVALRPVVELPDMAFDDTIGMTPRDMIAANVLAALFIRGPTLPQGTAAAVDPNRLDVKLYRDDVLINEGRGNQLMGDQWQALKWVVNEVVRRRGEVPSGALIIAGSLGKGYPAGAGNYRATFGELGEIAFRVDP